MWTALISTWMGALGANGSLRPIEVNASHATFALNLPADEAWRQPIAATSVGHVKVVRAEGDASFRIVVDFPAQPEPRQEVLLVAVPVPAGFRFLAAPLVIPGKAVITLETLPGAEVTLRALGSTHGPIEADRAGRVVFGLETAQSGFPYEYTVEVEGASVVGRGEVSPTRHPRPGVALIPLGAELPRPGESARVALVGIDSFKLRPISCASDDAVLEKVETEGWVSVWAVNISQHARRTVRLQCNGGNAFPRETRFSIAPPWPATLALAGAPPTAGRKVSEIQIAGVTAAGERVPVPKDVKITASPSPAGVPWDIAVQSVRPLPDGTVAVSLVYDSEFRGARAVVVEAASQEGQASGRIELPVVHGAMQALAVRFAEDRVVADDRKTFALTVYGRDAYGNVVEAEMPVVEAKLGSVVRAPGVFQYTPPNLRFGGTEALQVRAHGLETTADVELLAAHKLGAWVRAGVGVTHRGAVAPAIEARIGRVRGNFELALSVSGAVSNVREERIAASSVATRWWMVAPLADIFYTAVRRLPWTCGAGVGGGAAFLGRTVSASTNGARIAPKTSVLLANPSVAGEIRCEFSGKKLMGGLSARSIWAIPTGEASGTLLSLGTVSLGVVR